MVFAGFFAQNQLANLSLVGKTLTQLSTLDVSPNLSNPMGVIAKPDGLMFIVTNLGVGGNPNNRVFNAFTGNTAWDVSTMALTAQSSKVSLLEVDPDLGFTDITSEDGLNWYGIIDGYRIYHYQSTSSWDVTTIGTNVVDSYDISGEPGSELALCVQGTKLYYTNNGASNQRFRRLDISNSLSNATQDFDIDINPVRAQAVFVTPDGTRAFFTDVSDGELTQYEIDVGANTATFASNVYLPDASNPSIQAPRGIDTDNPYIVIADNTNDRLYTFKVT